MVVCEWFIRLAKTDLIGSNDAKIGRKGPDIWPPAPTIATQTVQKNNGRAAPRLAVVDFETQDCSVVNF